MSYDRARMAVSLWVEREHPFLLKEFGGAKAPPHSLFFYTILIGVVFGMVVWTYLPFND